MAHRKGSPKWILMKGARVQRMTIERRMYRNGSGLRDIAEAVGISHIQVRRDLLELHVPLRTPGQPRKASA